MKAFTIEPVSRSIEKTLQKKIDQKTKPLGALGKLEEIALQVGLIQQQLNPKLECPHLLVFAGDHGIAKEGVSAYPQEVTHQMVFNFLNEGAAINVFCKQHSIQLEIIDAGVNYDFKDTKGIINQKINWGTKNFLFEPAMTASELHDCIEKSSSLVNSIKNKGCNVIGFGEMGISNTSSASILMHLFCNLPLEECTGRGTGLDDNALIHKTAILKRAVRERNVSGNAWERLAAFGGFEIAQMCGAMLQAAENRMLLLVDGFIASAAFLAAYQLYPSVRDYAIFCHCSDEKGHQKLLNYLKASPLLHLQLRLGEGTGAAIAYPVIQSALLFLNNMASFESAGVSDKA